MSDTVLPLSTIGNTTPRIDAIERVTGGAKYTQRPQIARHAVRARAAQSASPRPRREH